MKIKKYNFSGFLLIILMFLISPVKASNKLYGIVKASVIHSNRPLNSSNNVNMVAPTSATNLEQYPGESGDRTTFQVAHSRIGGEFELSPDVRSLIELDFVDGSKASPTTQSNPRLRRAFVTTKFTENLELSIGQDWDIFSNYSPITFNFIGNYFNAGNVGFMREQIKILHHKDDNLLGLAIGQAGKNSEAVDSELEEKNRLSVSALFEKKISFFQFSVSGISAQRTINFMDKNIWGSSLGLKYTSSWLKFVLEAYYGEGLNKIELASLPTSTFSHEYGYYATSEFLISTEHSIYAGYGYASVERLSGPSSYDVTKHTFTNLGAKENTVWKTGYSFNKKNTKYYLEGSYFLTQYEKLNDAINIEFGIIASF